MTSTPPMPAAAAPEVLHFACGACRTHLTVPVSLSGVEGPCPACGVRLRAPARPEPAPPVAAVPTLPVRSTQPAVPAPARTVLPERARPLPVPGEATPPAPLAVPRPERKRRQRVIFRSKEKKPGKSPPRAPAPSASTTSLPDEELHVTRPMLATGSALLGALVVFGVTWWTGLRREPWTAVVPGNSAAASPEAMPGVDPLDALAEQRQEAAREVSAMLEAQRLALQFVTAATAAEAAVCLDDTRADPAEIEAVLTTARAVSPWRLTCTRRRRLPDAAGYLSSWRLRDESALHEITLEVRSGAGRTVIRWDSLRPAAGGPTAAQPAL